MGLEFAAGSADSKYEDGIVISQAALTYVPDVRDMKQTP